MASYGSSLKSASSSEDLCPITDDRKRKRMLSNRESARRSRMRKKKHLDDLTAQISQLTAENRQIMTTLQATTGLYMNVDAENSVLRAQISELNYRLQSLNEILKFADRCNHGIGNDDGIMIGADDGGYDEMMMMMMMMNPCGGSVHHANQQIMANHMLMY